MHIFHKWTKWRTVSLLTAVYITQIRTCEICGKIEQRIE